MRSFPRVALGLAMAVIGALGSAEAQDGLTKQDLQGPVTVTVALTALPAAGVPITVKVVLDTRSVGLDGIAFEKAVAVRTPEGADVAPTAVEAKGGGHHREALLVFPPLTSAGLVRIVVKDVGGVPERSFIWETPAKP